MLFWGAVAGAIGGILGGGGGWANVIGSVLGGIFGGEGGAGGWLGSILKLIEGLFGGNSREEAASNSVNQAFQQQPPAEERPSVPAAQPQLHPIEDRPTVPPAQPAPVETDESESSECCCCCCHGSDSDSDAPPSSAEPQGGLTVEGNTITTAGGYKIEILGPAEWRITDPEGHTTRIWGDPHVEEGDRNGATSEGNGGWDFKDNTTFVLGDGTEIHVTTVPRDNGSTVTGQLNIVNGDHAVEVTDMAGGMGKIGEVTTNGQEVSHQHSGYQDIYQGAEADDWTYNGREIVGSRGRGEELVLDDELAPGHDGAAPEPDTDTGTVPDVSDDGLDDTLFQPMSLSFNLGDLSLTLGVEENDQART